MRLPRRRGRLTVTGIALLAAIGLAILPNGAFGSNVVKDANLIDTGRVIGPLVGVGTEGDSSALVGATNLAAQSTTLDPGLVPAHGALLAKMKSSKPSIQKQPSNLSVKSGSRAIFVASAKGTPTPSVQWRESPTGKTWTTIKGAAKPTYSFVASPRLEGYRFEATFKNAAGSATTHAVRLTVISVPLVTLQPSAQAVESGQMATFTTGAAASPRPTVRWEMSTNGSSWSAVPGATTDMYSFVAALGQSGEEFEAIFKNSIGQTRTHVATLTVTPAPIAPVVVTQPVSATAIAGGTVSLTAAATGSPAPSVQWFVASGSASWSPVSGATSTTYSFTTAASESGYQYEAVFSNVAGSATSSPATLTVEVLPAVSGQPIGETVAAGAMATFSSSATGSPAPSVQWQVSTDGGTTWQSISGATTTTISFSATNEEALDQFEAVFSNAAGATTSASATLAVVPTQSSNWSGYTDFGSTFTTVSASWTVPAVTCPGTSTSYSSQWVGIDGDNAATTSVEQDGTEMDCQSGVPQYDAWFEMFGDDALNGGDELELSPSSYPVDPGDLISASVSVVNHPVNAPSTDTWTLTLTDASSGHAGWTASQTVNFTASEASAEWVIERPELCTSFCYLPALANFGSSTFTNAEATSTQGSGAVDFTPNTAIEMLGNTDNSLAEPSTLAASGTSFTDVWFGPS